MCHAQLPSLSGRMKKSPRAAIESGPPHGLGEIQCCACGRAEDGTSRVGLQGSVQLHWTETGHGVKTSVSRAEVTWGGHAVGTWTAGGVPWQGTFKLNWTGKVLPARDSQLTSVLYPREGVWLQKGVGGGAVPLLSLPCNSRHSACHPQQDSELYRWQPAPTQNWPPQLQALPERDRQEGEAAEEVAGRWVKLDGCRGMGPPYLLYPQLAALEIPVQNGGRALWGREPLEPLCSQQGCGESQSHFLTLPRAFSLSSEMAVFWGYTKP